jgi:hypothetical protein
LRLCFWCLNTAQCGLKHLWIVSWDRLRLRLNSGVGARKSHESAIIVNFPRAVIPLTAYAASVSAIPCYVYTVPRLVVENCKRIDTVMVHRKMNFRCRSRIEGLLVAQHADSTGMASRPTSRFRIRPHTVRRNRCCSSIARGGLIDCTVQEDSRVNM